MDAEAAAAVRAMLAEERAKQLAQRDEEIARAGMVMVNAWAVRMLVDSGALRDLDYGENVLHAACMLHDALREHERGER